MGLLFHPVTKTSIDNYLTSPAGAILIQAPAGSGKGSAASHIAAQLLEIDVNILVDSPNQKTINRGEDSITIEDIRELSSFLKLKTTGTATYRRAVIVEYAEQMGTEAQNAFLKGLEEPPTDTVIILTTNNSELLLPTITSRVQQINILPPSKKDVLAFFGDKYKTEEINRAYLLSGGAIGLMTALLESDTEHPLVSQINLAKDIYSKPVFERLNQIDSIIKSVDIANFLTALERVTYAALGQSATKNDNSTEAWHSRLRQILSSQNMLKNNPNSKLLLSNLFINL